MDKDKLDLLIKKSIVPRASLSSLVMCVSSVGKTDIHAACVFLKAICDQDIFKAASVTRCLSGKLAEECRNIVCDVLSQHVAHKETITAEDLRAILVFMDPRLSQIAISSLTSPMFSQVFPLCTSQEACSLMTMVLQYADENLIDPCLREFNAFLNHYESSGDSSLIQLLPLLLERNAVVTLSKLIEIIDIAKISSLYGNELFKELDRLIISGFDSLELWDAYFFFLFQTQHSLEELLVQGLWHIQLYASEESEQKAGACFYLYAAEHLDIDHPIFAFSKCFERPSHFSRKHTARYQDISRRFWETPERLARFLEKTEICNPFIGDILQENTLTLHQDNRNIREYNRLASLFENHASCEIILKAFFCSELKNNIPLENLLYLSQRYGVLEQMLEHLGMIELSGLVINHKIGEVILAPKLYCVMSLHAMQLEYHIIENSNAAVKEWKGKTLFYTITGFEKGQIYIRGVRKKTGDPNLLEGSKTWQESVASLEEHIVNGTEREFLASKRCSIYKYSVDSFINENDFGLLTDLYIRFPNRIDSLTLVLSGAKWNATFIAADAVFPPRFYSDFAKYQDQAIRMFKAMFATSTNAYADILNLYFASIYRVIVPLDRFLEIADREPMLNVLKGRTIYMRLLKKGQVLCRPLHFSCSPVCRVENAETLVSRQKFPAIITDYTKVGGVVSRIILEGQHIQPLDINERGSLFGYLALNERISKQKHTAIARLPDFDTYNSRELLFNLSCMEKAILLRKSSRVSLMELIHLLDTKNPFAFQRNIRTDVSYLGKLYSDERRKKMEDAMVSMVLNANRIEDIGDIYLNTCIKYYLRIEGLVNLVANRRIDLVDSLPKMFENVQFQCTADHDGWLWSPFVAQFSIKVGRQYAGMNLLCSLHPETDGMISACVISADNSNAALYPMVLCLMTGYQISDTIGPYLSVCLVAQNIIEDDNEKIQAILHDQARFRSLVVQSIGGQKSSCFEDKENSKFMQRLQQLHQILDKETYNQKEFVKQTIDMIHSYSGRVPMLYMEQALAELSKKLMQRSQNTTIIFHFLKKVFSCYSYGYRNNGLVHIWLSQLTECLGNDVAAQFSAEIHRNPQFLKNQ